MAARRPVLTLITVLSCALVSAGPAFPATPQKIYRDLADNGRLDHRYSKADLARAFNLERVVRTDAEAPTRRPAAVVAPETSPKRPQRRVPFSGLDLALLTAGGGPLLLIGLGLRRRIAASPRPGMARS